MVVDHVVLNAGLLHFLDQVGGGVEIPLRVAAGFPGSDAVSQNVQRRPQPDHRDVGTWHRNADVVEQATGLEHPARVQSWQLLHESRSLSLKPASGQKSCRAGSVVVGFGGFAGVGGVDLVPVLG